MLDGQENTQGQDAAGEVDQIEKLAAAFHGLREEFAEVEIHRATGTGRGGGALEWIENLPLDVYGLADILTRLRDEHGGGRFRLIVRDENKPGLFRMCQTVQVVRRIAPTSQAQPPAAGAQGDMMRMVFEQMQAQQAVMMAGFRELAGAMTARAGSIDDDLTRLAKIREAFGGNQAPTVQQQPDMLELIDKVFSLRERLDRLGGKADADPWAEIAKEFLPGVLAAMRGSDEDEGEEYEDDAPANPAAGDPEAAIRAQLAGFTGTMLQAANAGVSPDKAASVALSHVKNKSSLVRFCQKANATGLLIQIAPALLTHAGWVEQVRAQIVKQAGTASIAAPIPAHQQEEAASHAHDAGANTGRAGRGPRNAPANAGTDGAGQAPANGSGAGRDADRKPAAKGVQRRGGKPAQVREGSDSVRA